VGGRGSASFLLFFLVWDMALYLFMQCFLFELEVSIFLDEMTPLSSLVPQEGFFSLLLPPPIQLGRIYRTLPFPEPFLSVGSPF